MREVTLTWEEASLAKTDLVELIDVVDGLTFVANLHITPEGVRQVVLPSYKEGKTVDDLDQIPYVEVEQHLDDREARRFRGLEHPSPRLLGGKIHEHPRHVTNHSRKRETVFDGERVA